MAISFVASATTVYSARQYVAIPNPTGLAVDDLILVYHIVGVAGTPSAPTTVPTGFLVLDGPVSNADNGGFTLNNRIYYKFAVDADAGVSPVNTTWQWGQSTATESVQGITVIYRGVDKTNFLDVASSTDIHTPGSGGGTYTFKSLSFQPRNPDSYGACFCLYV